MPSSVHVFDELVESYYQAWFRYHPEAAVDAGVEGYAHLLAPYGSDDIGALTALNEKLIDGLDGLDRAALDTERRLDFQILYGAAMLELHELFEADWRYCNPLGFLPLHAIRQLTLSPVKNLERALESRLAQVPEYLRGARSHLLEHPQRVPPEWVAMALDDAGAGAAYLRGLRHDPLLAAKRALRKPGLQPLLERAAQALVDYARFLETELAPRACGQLARGETHYARVLDLRHGLHVDAGELAPLARRLYEDAARALRAECRRLTGSEQVGALLGKLRASAPAPAELLDCYREAAAGAHRFLRARDLLTLPLTYDVKFAETPELLRERFPHGFFQAPAPDDPAKRAYCFVTPPHAHWPDEHYALGIRHACVRQLWPGRLVQSMLVNARYSSRSLPRLLSPSASLCGGWPLYSEVLMVEQGFLDEPQSRALLLRQLLGAALRLLLDVELHANMRTLESAALQLAEEVALPVEYARRELSRASLQPAEAAGGALGLALLEALREQLRAQGSTIARKSLHDRVLFGGSVPLPLVIRRYFGESLWERLQDSLLKAPVCQR